MQFEITVVDMLSQPVKTTRFNWTLEKENQIAAGTADTDANGKTVINVVPTVPTGAELKIFNAALEGGLSVAFPKAKLVKTIDVKPRKTSDQGSVDAGSNYSIGYDLTVNNNTEWDWLVWETEGNSDPKYQRGGKERKLGLYRVNYDKLRRRDGSEEWADAHTNGTIGGAKVMVAVLEDLDYSRHKELIKTFLPSFKITGGKITEPLYRAIRYQAMTVSRSTVGATTLNTGDFKPPYIVMPFNYDDNSDNSKALGKTLTADPLPTFEAARLNAELTRWATASRSTIAAFTAADVDLTPQPKNQWTLRSSVESDGRLPQVTGNLALQTLRQYQNTPTNSATRYYSVKTGVDFVSTQEQGRLTNKDLLEENSVHAMHRSNLIYKTMQRFGESVFEAKYQLEILCVLIEGRKNLETGENKFDGFQIREVGKAAVGEVWFPGLAIPGHGKAFAEKWGGITGEGWLDFWKENFAKPMGRAKAEMLVFFGMQHMTSNSQNFLVAFSRPPAGASPKSKHLILRDIGDTLYNNNFFDVLKTVHPSYDEAWAEEHAVDPLLGDNGITLTKGWAGSKYTCPKILRIGPGIVFFFEPFYKGDIEAHPRGVDILVDWCVAHNYAFLDYMKQAIGYRENWSDAGDDTYKPDLPGRILKFSTLNKALESEYVKVVDEVLKIKPARRWEMLRKIELDRTTNPPTIFNDGKGFVNGHELLICAEVHQFIQSPAGKAGLVDFHKRGGKLLPVQPVVSTEACLSCQTVKPTPARDWLKCQDCRSLFCINCGKNLKFPVGTLKSLEKLTPERRCGKENCRGIAIRL